MQFTPKGIYTALVTPFTAAHEFDEPAFRRLIDFQVDEGAAGLLVIGGSGEFVAKAGADAVLVLPSYYIKASPAGIYEHFARVADAASIPIVAYNNAGRTGITLDVSMLEKLATIPSIVALKECERDLAVVAAKISAFGDRIAILSGDDDLGFPTFLLGSPGGIFMTANLVPAFHHKLFEAATNSGSAISDLAIARTAHYALLSLVEALYTADHPGPLKDAMALIGHPVGPARAPLQRASAENLKRAEAALQKLAAVSFG
jgi:4-hydroxy-tetrahydrodipicolinate synthase